MRLLSRFAALLILIVPGTIYASEVGGWKAARWGMTEADLRQVFGEDLQRLPGRWEYGGAYATYAMATTLGGQNFRAMLQMNAETDRLQQVLLEPVKRPGQERLFGAVFAELKRVYGAPTGSCRVPRAGGGPKSVDIWWQNLKTTVHLAFFDFYSSGIFYDDPTRDRDPLLPYFKTRQNNPRFLPRRTLVRFHPTERQDLLANPCR